MESQEPRVPPVLVGVASYCWRLLVVGAVVVVLYKALAYLALVVLPVAAALLLAALLGPVVRYLRRRGMGRASAASLTFVFGLGVITAVVWFVVDRVAAQVPQLVGQFQHVLDQSQRMLERSPLHLAPKTFGEIGERLLGAADKQHADVLTGVLSTTGKVLEYTAAALLGLFTTFFLLYDGERIWAWVLSLLRPGMQARVDAGGKKAWLTLAGWVHGTILVATFHGIVITIALLVLGMPLVAPLAVLVFLGSFVPLVGAISAGALAVLVALVAKGPFTALIVVAVLVVENQAEAHLLQPLIVGRYVRLHPLATALVLTAGTLIAGIPGAIVAVPLAASLRQGWHGFSAPS